ncbi:hypothetical protein ACHAW5_002412 [Stephanodiscus triporus]|uniref:ATP-dependent RNA helicase n=1 Tax=Stephanodiscus triporus TaxID=2934178 RepID=A0ABD3P1B1_9STRA
MPDRRSTGPTKEFLSTERGLLAMGGNRRRRRKVDACGEDSTNGRDDKILVRIESSTTADDRKFDHPPVWSVDFVENIEKKSHKLDATASIADIGLQIVRGTLDRISRRNHKSSRKNSGFSSSNMTVKPTPIQLRLWPALLDSFESKARAETSAALNVVGIAPTGTGKNIAKPKCIPSHDLFCVAELLFQILPGKTLSYAIPIISHCVRALLCEATHTRRSKHSAKVHGLILVPTRELAIQVSKEMHLVAKVAKKYLSKCAPVNADTSMRVESLPVYGGVDIESQVSSLLGTDESLYLSLVVVATPGRLLDILKSDSNRKSAASVFGNLHAIVFDEADRIAMNADMAGQVDDIVSVLRSVRVSAFNGGGVLSCLVSATLPEKAKEMCEKWVPRSRIVVKVDSVVMGNEPSANHPCETNGGEDDEESANASPSKRNISFDLSSIPSNIVQTLHVCSNHKKPKKLILTLQRIYNKKDEGKGRFSVNNRLTIVFFGQIKTVKYVSKLLVREGLRCVELYGSLHQTEREKRLLEFKSGKTPILLATDIAARGIHINNVHYVVNYDFPSSLDQYVHRCGRAGRKEALNGEVSQYPPTVYSFFTREFSAMAGSIVELLETCHAWVDPNLIALTEESKSSANRSTKDGQRKRKRGIKSSDDTGRTGKTEGDVDSDNDDGQFSFLGKTTLKRASHVSDAEDSDDDEST